MAEYKMADDFDKMKDESLKSRYKKLSKDIFSIGVNVAPSAIENLKNSINQLAQQASTAGITLDIDALKINLEIVEFQVEHNQSKIINETNAQDNTELTEEDKQKIADDTAGRVYKTFDGFHKDFLKKQKEDNKNLDKALENIAKGLDVDEETKKKLKKTPEQIEEEKLRWQHIELTNKIAEDRYKYHSESIEKIDQQIAKLDAHHHHTEIAALENQKKHHKQHCDLAKTEKAKCEEHYRKRDERAKQLIECRESAEKHENQGNKELVATIKGYFYTKHGTSPKRILAESAQKEAKKIHQTLITNKDTVKKKVDSKQSTTEQLDKKSKIVVNNNKSKHSSQWEI